ncbi:MAG: aldo/keto reductase [Coriobacteriia bacterium]|nr:aldo/keto reductase [Coriobacteriia bacterium]
MPTRPTITSLADTVEIAPGVLMPRLGLGTYKSDEGPDVEGEVTAGFELGYRLIDTAALYGNEPSIGHALRASGIPRDEVFLTTKLWNDDQGYESTLSACESSLERLGVDHVDLYLIHWPWVERMRDTWRAMEQLLASGHTRAIGVCNFLPHHLDTLAEFASVMPAVNQFEFHPRLQQPELQAACERYGITLQAWAPIMRGRVNLIPELVGIAGAHRKTPAQVSIRWILQKGFVTIPKSIHPARIAENCDVYDFELTAEEMATIDALDACERIGPNPETYVTGNSD